MDAIREIILPAIYLIVNAAHAYWHSVRIKKLELITAKRKRAEVIIINSIAILALFFFFKFLPVLVFAFLTRIAFYDPLLAIFRGKSWLYEGEISWRKSWADRVEHGIGLPTWAFRIIYLLIYIGYSIYYYATNN
jgi:hypothetical protein